ncbi:hypothetical protein FOL47_002999 [Perkinsus chesapeaki]|uniref:DSBA-like thioredoxin domain-containing protein n=1 Tax=Perkinsus chesapeaki TaxID=330153 RepID=A0A7J6N0P7_PERCH|nr:hypothetical protein FOL47_002999 [Perkinsus chesapeaki]
MSIHVPISIVSDFVCPWCFVGRHNLGKALESIKERDSRVTFEIHWRPYFQNPSLTETVDRASYYFGKFGESQFRAMHGELRAAAKAAGFEIGPVKGKLSPTIKAHLLMEWAYDKGGWEKADKLETIIQSKHFHDYLDIGQDDVLASAAEEAGFDPNEARKSFENVKTVSDIRDQTRRLAQWANQLDVTGLPFIVIGDVEEDDDDAVQFLVGAKDPEVMKLQIESYLTERYQE